MRDNGRSAEPIRTQPGRRIRTLAAFALAALGILLVVGGRLAAASGEAAADTSTVAEVAALVTRDGDLEVRLTILVDTSVADPHAALAELVPGYAPAPGGATAAFVEWTRWPAESIPVVMHYNAASALGGIDAPAAIAAAMEKWNNAGGHTFRFEYGGTTAASPPRCNVDVVRDGVNAIGWRNDLPSGTLATTCAITSRGVPLEMDIAFSTQMRWSTAQDTPADHFDYHSTLLHELGHVVGLDHTSAAGAVMLAQIGYGQQRRSLTEDDIAGIRALYPAPGGASPTATPTAPQTAAPTPTPEPTPPRPPTIEPAPRPALPVAISIAGIARE